VNTGVEPSRRRSGQLRALGFGIARRTQEILITIKLSAAMFPIGRKRENLDMGNLFNTARRV